MAQKLIIGNGTLVTLGENNRILDKGAVYIEGNIIKDFGPDSKIKVKYKDAKYHDAQGKTIMPGLICAHHHLYSTFACGISAEPAANFVEILNKLWWKLDRALKLEDVYYSAMIPLIKCIKAGTTTIIDHHASPSSIIGSLDKIAEATKLAGVRANLCYELTDRGGEKEISQGIEENISFLERCKSDGDSMLSGLFGLHASMTLSTKTMQRALDAVCGLDAGFHIHVAEDKADVADSLSKYKMRVIERLKSLGILGEKSIAAHCIHINEKEMNILKETGTNAVHNPQSNMNNSVGCADVLKMLSKGVLVGLGSDGMTSNMYDEMRTALLVQHHVQQDPRVAFVESIDLLVKNNIKIASKLVNAKVGTIEKGALADVIIVDYYPYTPISANNFYGHFMFGIASVPVDTTVINGKFVMKNKKLVNIDETEIYRQAGKLSKKVWDRF